MHDNKRAKLYLENMPLFKDKKALEQINTTENAKVKASIIVGLAQAAIFMVVNLVAYFSMFGRFRKQAREEKKLAKELKAILGSKQDWTVLSVDDRAPNAFTLGRNFMVMTRGLYKMLDDDEIMAVLLHEAGHNAGHHVAKKLAAMGTFAAIAGQAMGFTAIYGGLVMGPFAIFFALLIYFLLLGKQIEIYNVTIGRKHEYYADSYAAKFGYGDQLISALKKLDKWVNSEMKKRPCGPECRKQIELSEKMDEHPSIKDRVDNILKNNLAKIVKMSGSASSLKAFFLKELGVKK